jgi:TetR/AcrR family transcriptional regulator, cholesterol catabolism regulator
LFSRIRPARGNTIAPLNEEPETLPLAATIGDPIRRSALSEVTRLRIQKVALDLFWEKGYKSTTTRDVAAGLGVQQASLYYHIKNKEELLHGICYSSFIQVIQNAEAAVAASRDPLDRVRQIGRNHLTTTLAYQKEFSVSIMECHALSPGYRAQIEELWQRYKTLIYSTLDGAKAAGVIRSDVPNRYLYMALMSMLNWSVIWYRPGKGLNVGELDQIFATIYFSGASNPASRHTWHAAAARRVTSFPSSPITASVAIPASETHARLLDAACTLFTRKGYFATSIREIADLMGMQKASLYYYISTKEDLLYQISRAALEHVSAGVKAALKQVSSPVDRVHALITSHVVSLLQHQNWYAAANDELHALSPTRRAEIVALRDEYELLLRSTLEDAQTAGILRADVPAKFLGLVLLGMINHIYPWYQPEIDLTPVELGSLLADLFMTGVASGNAIHTT